ncbi:hypothetical protein AOLI_G00216580 [Acnodon oligacanthus]
MCNVTRCDICMTATAVSPPQRNIVDYGESQNPGVCNSPIAVDGTSVVDYSPISNYEERIETSRIPDHFTSTVKFVLFNEDTVSLFDEGTDSSRIAFVMSLLTGNALSWATAMWQAQVPESSTYANFEHVFQEVFDHPVSGKHPGERLLTLKQGSKTAAEDTLHFRILTAEAGLDKRSLKTLYHRSLNETLQRELSCRDSDDSLSDFIQLTISLDNLVCSRHSPVTSSPIVPSVILFTSGSMEIGRVQLTPEERQRRMHEGLCFYCGLQEHFRSDCSTLRNLKRVNETILLLKAANSLYP